MLSLYALILYGIGYALDAQFGTTVFKVLPGLAIVLWLPGYAIVEALYRKTFNRPEKLLLSTLLSLCSVSLFAYMGYSLFKIPLFPSRLALVVVCGTALLVILKIFLRRKEAFAHLTPNLSWQPQFRQHWPLFLALGTYLAVHLINFLIYPYIPEADGHAVIHQIHESLSTGYYGGISYRPFFPLYGMSFSAVTGLDATALFKYVLPLSYAVMVIPFYVLARRLKLSPWTQFLASIVPVTVPVIVHETEYVRPQSAIILLTVTVVWLLIRYASENAWNLYSLALGLAIFGIAYHEFALFSIATALIACLPDLWKEVQRSPRKVAFAAIYAAVALTPYLALAGTRRFVTGLAGSLLAKIAQGHFTWWFISSYVNVDGNNLGWPGWQSALYYGYNLGILTVALIGIAAWYRLRKKPAATPALSLAPAWILFGLTLFFSEITPRFGAAYLPDRSWLFLAIAISFVVVPLMPRLTARPARILVALACVSSLFAVWTVTYLKQGWIVTPEYEAAVWLREHTPANSQVISQHGNGPLIQTYAQRESIGIPELFLLPHDQQEALLANAREKDPALTETEAPYYDKVQDALSAYRGTNDPESADRAYAVLGEQLQELQKAKTSRLLSDRLKLDGPQPTYVLYSLAKFDNLYSTRDWWRRDNAFGADLSTLQTLPNLREVFSNGKVTIWEYVP